MEKEFKEKLPVVLKPISRLKLPIKKDKMIESTYGALVSLFMR